METNQQNSNSLQESTIVVKLQLNGEIRRLSFPSSLSFKDLCNATRQLLPKQSNQEIELNFRYTDSEGDEITVSSQLDLNEAISAFHQSSNQTILKFVVVELIKEKPNDSQSNSIASSKQQQISEKRENSENLLQSFEMEQFTENVPDTEKIILDFLHLLPPETANILAIQIQQPKEEIQQNQQQKQDSQEKQLQQTIQHQEQSQNNNIIDDNSLFTGVLDPHDKVDVVDYETHYDVEARLIPHVNSSKHYVTNSTSNQIPYAESTKSSLKESPYVTTETDNTEQAFSTVKNNNQGISYAESRSDSKESYSTVGNSSYSYTISVHGEGHCEAKKSENNYKSTSIASHPYCYAY